MTDPILRDSMMDSAMFALDGLAHRQQVIGRNLANIDTPDFQAQSLSFEGVLKQQMSRSGSMRLNVTHTGHLAAATPAVSVQINPRQGGSARADGNNVDLDVELNELGETSLRYQAMTSSISKKLSLLKYLAR